MFASLFGELEDRPKFADVRVGWHESGLAISVSVKNKNQNAWCRESRPVDSDGLTLLLATRDVQNVHRANRFCHRFVFLPAGAGTRGDRPSPGLVAIDRCRENPKVPDAQVIRIKSKLRAGGYSMRVFLPAAALTGYSPSEFPSLGFSYLLSDRELGWQTFTVGSGPAVHGRPNAVGEP